MHALPYSHPAVRDLAWSLGGAPLLLLHDSAVCWPDTAWYTEILADFHPHLEQLDKDPRPLLERLSGRADHRLGSYFETLWHYWLDNNPRYRLLDANLPVRAAGRTLGEFDLIVADRHTGRTSHWELALKFYLGEHDTSDPANWWGPARRDRLDIKTAHLLQHQSRLSGQPEAQSLLAARGIHIAERRIIMKGRLFYPVSGRHPAVSGSCRAQLRGSWLYGRQLEQQPARQWQVLEKRQWLAPLSEPTGPLLSGAELADWWYRGSHRHPVCTVTFTDGGESGRWFVVPDDWDN